MKRFIVLVVAGIVLLTVTIGTAAPPPGFEPGNYGYCPFCPPPHSSDTPSEKLPDTPSEKLIPSRLFSTMQPVPYSKPSERAIPIRPTHCQYENPSLIAYIDELENISDPNVVIVDVRSPGEYAEGHIHGAINLHWEDFRGEKGVFKGVETATKILGEKGISQENRVIVYCASTTGKPCPASAYVFWMLEYLWHENVSVLDGGFDAWNATYGCTKSVKTRSPTTYTANLREERFADTEWVQNNLNNTRVQIVDARTAEEYSAGHIDSAINLDYERLFRAGYRMKGVNNLEYLLSPIVGIGLDKSKDTIVYCRSGARSSFLYLALRLMGYQVRNYDGSWNIWGETHSVSTIAISNVSVNPRSAYEGTPEVVNPSERREGTTGTSTASLISSYSNASYIPNSRLNRHFWTS